VVAVNAQMSTHTAVMLTQILFLFVCVNNIRKEDNANRRKMKDHVKHLIGITARVDLCMASFTKQLSCLNIIVTVIF